MRELCWQVEWHSGTKRQRQDFWTDVVHNACQSLLGDEKTEEEEEFRGHLRRLTKENNVPRKRQARAYWLTACRRRRRNKTPVDEVSVSLFGGWRHREKPTCKAAACGATEVKMPVKGRLTNTSLPSSSVPRAEVSFRITRQSLSVSKARKGTRYQLACGTPSMANSKKKSGPAWTAS